MQYFAALLGAALGAVDIIHNKRNISFSPVRQKDMLLCILITSVRGVQYEVNLI